jgi:hypothetical protein
VPESGKSRSGWVEDYDRVRVFQINANSREELLEIGRLIEAVTWAMARPEPPASEPARADVQPAAKRKGWWRWRAS